MVTMKWKMTKGQWKGKGKGKGKGKTMGKSKGEKSKHTFSMFCGCVFVGQATLSLYCFSGMSKKKEKRKYYPKAPTSNSDCRSCSTSCISVSDILLVDSKSNKRLFSIQPGEMLDFDELEVLYGTTEFSVECIAEGNVGSMLIADSYGTRYVDNEPPFILAGDIGGVFLDSNFQQSTGIWRVACQPYCKDGARGQAGPIERISFFVESTGQKESPAPTVATIPSPPTTECNECRSGCISVVDFVLVDTSTNTQIRSLVPGGT